MDDFLKEGCWVLKTIRTSHVKIVQIVSRNMHIESEYKYIKEGKNEDINKEQKSLEGEISIPKCVSIRLSLATSVASSLFLAPQT